MTIIFLPAPLSIDEAPLDPLLKHMLATHKPERLVGYHEHDSLLADQVRSSNKALVCCG
jgi:hypothetical protein